MGLTVIVEYENIEVTDKAILHLHGRVMGSTALKAKRVMPERASWVLGVSKPIYADVLAKLHSDFFAKLRNSQQTICNEMLQWLQVST